jgi:arsenite methyltransferase
MTTTKEISMPSLKLDTPDLAATYDQVSDKQFEHGKLLLELLHIQSGERVLDIGCGTGRLGEHVAQTLVGPRGVVVGVDPLPHRIEIARRRASSNHLAGVASSENTREFAESNSFDVAYLNSVYHWLPEKLPTLFEARRALKVGGRIGISVASLERPHELQGILQKVGRDSGLSQDLGGSAPHKVSAAQLARQLEDSGFLIDQISLRVFTDTFADADEVIAFNRSSSFGNFLAETPEDIRRRVLAALSAELNRRRTINGIVLKRRLLFAIATAA